MVFLRFMQEDPFYKPLMTEVAVNPGQIVKIIPRYYKIGSDGQAYSYHVRTPGEKELMEGVLRHFIVHDSLGNTYDSETLTPEAKEFIQKLWQESK